MKSIFLVFLMLMAQMINTVQSATQTIKQDKIVVSPRDSSLLPTTAAVKGISESSLQDLKGDNIAPAAQLASPLPGQSDSARFCANIDSQALDTRFKLQSQQLSTLRVQIDERIKLLEEKRKEYETWLKGRNDFLDKVESSLVDIITKMRPDAAAAQLALTGDLPAAAILLKLNPRTASSIMNELPPKKAATLTSILVSIQSTPSKAAK
ncbi:MotE family protein [Bartonella sp. DGB2]|uniref:MotE family protein n=1 Tax=Bartonella sp. DGB2 TaxID=3388426 RepID=UPI00398FA1FF